MDAPRGSCWRRRANLATFVVSISLTAPRPRARNADQNGDSRSRPDSRIPVRESVLAASVVLAIVLSPLSGAAQSSQPGQAQTGSPVKLHAKEVPYTPLTPQQRFDWFVDEMAGPEHVAAGVLSAAWGTALDNPPEYRGTWAGFGKRFAVREAGVGLGNAMEAGLGALWGEDPRYFRAAGEPFGTRVRNVFKQTFVAKRPDGSFHPAFARYAGVVGNNVISDAWRAPSESDAGHTVGRVGWGLLARAAANAFDEFWPDAKQRLFHRRH